MSFEVSYSLLERLLHRAAFGTRGTQLVAAGIEKSLFSRGYSQVTLRIPTFITSLPRAGTTILLNALNRLSAVATHTYRDMPFILAPVMWEKLSGPFQKRGEPRERAHRDGIQIDYDSPEAFEEVFWRTFWEDKYREDRIQMWKVSDYEESATRFLQDHMKKIIALRCRGCYRGARYLSKNNANLARLELIPRMFSDACVVVLVRSPVDHAASLLRQHKNFLRLHESDRFSKRYMRDIGHFEFGDLHMPIAFPGVEQLIRDRNPTTIDYWLAYWVSAFEYVCSHRNRVTFVSYERLCREPKLELAKLCDNIALSGGDEFLEAVRLFQNRGQDPDLGQPDSKLRERAEDIYKELLE